MHWVVRGAKPQICTVLTIVTLAQSLVTPGLEAGSKTHAFDEKPGSVLALNANTPRTDGTFVVWQQYGDEEVSDAGDIYAIDLRDPEPFPLAEGSAEQRSPKVDAGVAIWTERSGSVVAIQGYRLFEDSPFAIASWTDERQEYPDTRASIFDRWAIWVSPGEQAGSEQLWARNIATMEGAVLLRDLKGEIFPTINEDLVAWLEHDRLTSSVNLWIWDAADKDVPARVLETTVLSDDSVPMIAPPAVSRSWIVWLEVPVSLDATERSLLVSALDDWQPFAIAPEASHFDLDGVVVAYQAQGRIMAYNLIEHWTHDLAEGMSPVVKGRLVFYESFASHPEVSSRYPFLVLAGYDLQTDSRFTITEFGPIGSPFSFQVAAHEPVIVWTMIEETADTRLEAVRSAILTEILPSAPRTIPSAPDPARAYFPETSHSLQLGFYDFWQKSGGLPVFGYPLTEEYQELSPDTGAFHTVQFTERQRFEWHRELAETPYEIQLGRLGAERAERLGMVHWGAFQPLVEDDAPSTECLYFPETGHFICPPFLAYWLTHGLEFGDEDVSYRESLALFGYPISEPFIMTNADGDTVLTQYFERAVFEYHPNNPEPYTVLQRRVGAEVLEARGW